MFVLSETRGWDWVESLCPADLFHYYDLHLEVRSERLREELNVLLSASLAPHDKGAAYQEMDKRLAPKSAPKAKPKTKPIPLEMTPAERAKADRVSGKASEMWRPWGGKRP